MQNVGSLNYLVDLYAIGWCFLLLYHEIKHKGSLFMLSWSLAQLLIFIINFLNGFVNKGYCLFSNCEPTNTIRLFLDLNFPPNTLVLIRFTSVSLMFLAIIKMHLFIEKEIKKSI